jgi:hypothetical protein
MTFLIAALACYRLSRMIARERGPWSCFEKLRGWVVHRYPPVVKHLSGGVSYEQGHWITEGIVCPLCLSVWVALVLAIPLCTDVVEYSYMVFGLSGAAALLYKIER